MIVVFILVLLVLLGFGLYATAIQLGWLGSKGESTPDDGRMWWERREPSGSRESRLGVYLEAVPRGCLVSAMIVMGLWIAAWLVFLIVGLNFLWSVQG